jgi:hypothetical protein
MLSDEYFKDWLSDNEDELIKEFLETEYDKFMAYCREQFANEREYQ